jgi:hypothetical protein
MKKKKPANRGLFPLDPEPRGGAERPDRPVCLNPVPGARALYPEPRALCPVPCTKYFEIKCTDSFHFSFKYITVNRNRPQAVTPEPQAQRNQMRTHQEAGQRVRKKSTLFASDFQ